MQPIVQCIKLGAGPCLTRLAPYLGQLTADLRFDAVQLTNTADGLQGLGAALLFGNVVELASNMGPAGRLLYPPTVIQRIEPGVPISLNNALEVFKMFLWVFAFAIRRVPEPHRRRLLTGCCPVIAHIGP